MDEFTHGGTPPPLWPKVRAPENTTNYQSRIAALARQVEKLSWMLSYMDEGCEDERYHAPLDTIEEVERAWRCEHASLN